MKLIGNELGRVVILAHAEEWRPTRGIPLAAAVAAIQGRYNFIVSPILSAEAILEADRNGYRFVNGTFDIDHVTVAIRDLVIFRDGMSVTAHDTSYAETFLDDFIQWGISEFGLRPFAQRPPQMFRSQLVAQFERPLSKAFRKFERLTSMVRGVMEPYQPYSAQVNVTRLDFGMDPLEIPGIIRPSPLVLERRLNHPHGREVYFSDAPLPSKAHFDLLQQFESDLA